MIEYRSVNGHIEVYRDGVFLFSADSMVEAYQEVDLLPSPYAVCTKSGGTTDARA